MTLIAFLILIFSIIGITIYAVREYLSRDRGRKITMVDEILNHVPLEKAFEQFNLHQSNQYLCLKCYSKKYRSSMMDGRFAELYCLECGYKEFYNMEVRAGFNDEASRLANNDPVQYLPNDNSMCSKCKSLDRIQFIWKKNVPHKMGGYGDRRITAFKIFSCKVCSYSEFYDLKLDEKQILNEIRHA